jgi:hypothetical protein
VIAAPAGTVSIGNTEPGIGSLPPARRATRRFRSAASNPRNRGPGPLLTIWKGTRGDVATLIRAI